MEKDILVMLDRVKGSDYSHPCLGELKLYTFWMLWFRALLQNRSMQGSQGIVHYALDRARGAEGHLQYVTICGPVSNVFHSLCQGFYDCL